MCMRILFMGTPEFSVTILNGLASKHDIVGVVTQPDKPVGRKKELLSSPVKQWAVTHQIPLFQPNRIKDEYEALVKLNADIIVTAAYGQFVNMDLINRHKYKAINVHASLLPKYRGGAPIHQAIKDGCSETGVSIIYMERKMDAGDILAMDKLPILDSDTCGELFEKLSVLGSSLVLSVLDDIDQGKSHAIPQDHSQATFAFNVTKEEEQLDFSKNAIQVRNHIRAYNPNPGAYTLIEGNVIKIYEAKVSNKTHNLDVGSIVDISKDSFVIACGNQTALEILTIKPQGKNMMSVKDYLNGNGKQILKRIEKVGI